MPYLALPYLALPYLTLGECFVFNDAYAHEVAFDPQSAKRTPAAVRTVLVVDVWHEGLTAAERAILGLDVFGRFGRS